jgi:hypothetical protein
MPETLRQAFEQSGKTKRQRYEQHFEALKRERSSFDSHYMALASYFRPRRIRLQITDRNKGDARNQNIIDSTGVFAVDVASAGLHTGLTSPSRPWFTMQTPDPNLSRGNKRVEVWLKDATQILLDLMSDSTLYDSLHEVFGDLLTFATAAMSVLPDEEDVFRSESYPVGSYVVAFDHLRKPVVFAHEYECTVLELVEEFAVRPGGWDVDWSTVSSHAKEQFTQGNLTAPCRVTWMITKNYEHDPDRLQAKYKKFASCHWETLDQAEEGQRGKFLRESGFDTFPVMVPRWFTTGRNSYGDSCPGMVALGDNKQLQVQNQYEGKAIVKMVDPPLVGEHELINQPVSQVAGGITFVRNPQHGLRALYEVNLGLDHLNLSMERTAQRINRAFYVDLFLAVTRDARSQPPTAEEIRARFQEKLLGLGPVFNRTDSELLSPMIDRMYELADARGYIPEVPEELAEVPLKIEYTSILMQALKMAVLGQTDRFLSSVAGMSQFYPEMAYKIRAFKAVDIYREQTGADPELVFSDEEAGERFAQAQQAAQAQAEAERGVLIAKAMKDSSQAQMGTDSALDRVVRSTAS